MLKSGKIASRVLSVEYLLTTNNTTHPTSLNRNKLFENFAGAGVKLKVVKIPVQDKYDNA
jgi:hypothetical protein